MLIKNLVVVSLAIAFCLLSTSGNASDASPDARKPGNANPSRPVALAKVCRVDVKAQCSSIKPGGGRIMCCLKKVESSIAAECKSALEALPKYQGLDAGS